MPMLRRLLNIASIVCLVLCVALMGMWVRSYHWVDHSRPIFCCEMVCGRIRAGPRCRVNVGSENLRRLALAGTLGAPYRHEGNLSSFGIHEVLTIHSGI